MSDLLPPPAPRALGRGGPAIGPVAWGMWRFAGVGEARARALVEAALAAGATLLDTADIYGWDGAAGFGEAEALLGRVLAAAPGLRDRLVLATKGGIAPPAPYDASAGHLTAALEASLRRLGTDRVDLYQVHRPDLLAHPHEVARALADMVASGKALAVGVSNYSPAQVRALAAFLPVPLASLQPELSPLAIGPIDDGLADLAMAEGYAVLAWSPLGGGRIIDPATPRERAVAAALDAVAGPAGVGRAAAALGWVMAHPMGAVPILGTTDPARLAAAGEAVSLRWTRAQWYAVLAAARGEPLP